MATAAVVEAIELRESLKLEAAEAGSTDISGTVIGDDEGDDGDATAAASSDEPQDLSGLSSELYSMQDELFEMRRAARSVVDMLADELAELISAVSDFPHCASSFTTEPTDDGEACQEYVIKKIIGRRCNSRYLCLWSSGGGVSWEKEKDIECVSLIEEYNKRVEERGRELVRVYNASHVKQRSVRPGLGTKKVISARKRKQQQQQKQQQKDIPAHPGFGTGIQRPVRTTSEEDRLMSLDIPALRAYLQTVQEFTPLHYDLLLRLSEDEVSRGASVAAIASLATVDTSNLPADHSCGICLDDDTSGTHLRLRCDHIFHSACIKEWLAKEKTCPLCKTEVQEG